MFSTLTDDGPPGGTPRDDAAAYQRYARWASRKLIGGESYRGIAASDLSSASTPGDDARDIVADGRERWREVRRGIRKALAILDSI